MGLMKIATYHRMLGDDVQFYKGDLKDFVINAIAEQAITKLRNIDDSVTWCEYKPVVVAYIKTKRSEVINEIRLATQYEALVVACLIGFM